MYLIPSYQALPEELDIYRDPTDNFRHLVSTKISGGCFTNVSRALQNILSKFVYCKNSTCDENFKLKLCACAQSHALGTRTKFQLEILTVNVISGVVYFREIIYGELAKR